MREIQPAILKTTSCARNGHKIISDVKKNHSISTFPTFLDKLSFLLQSIIPLLNDLPRVLNTRCLNNHPARKDFSFVNIESIEKRWRTKRRVR